MIVAHLYSWWHLIGLLFGAVSTEAGLSLIETMAMIVLVIAGAAQFTALALLE